MAFIHLTKDKLYRYIPVRERKEKNPLIVHLKYLPAVVYDEYIRAANSELETVSGTKQRQAISDAHDKQTFLNHVKKVENFIDEDGTQITDIDTFIGSIDLELQREIIAAFSNNARLTSVDLKNLLGALDTLTSSETPSPHSTAKPAKEKKNETVKTEKD